MSFFQQEAKESDSAGIPVPTKELRLVEALRRGDETAFASLLDAHHAPMLRLALIFVSDRAVAEEVVQEAWFGVVQGLDRFQGRSSLKTWIFSILTNCAKTRARREGRTVPFSAVWDPKVEPDEPAVDPDRFLPADDPEWSHHWVSFPHSWEAIPEEHLLSQEVRAVIEQALQALPPSQRQVITLRDIKGWTCDEVCNVLEINETNQRVLLHRARAKVRRALERYFDEEDV
jgi:RNA polymerase sigma-70 factor (ECF subfamily)